MARKLNTRFILIVALIVGGLMVGGAGAVWWRRHHQDPKKLLATAEKFEKEGNYLEAARYYRGAGLIMHDAKTISKAGDLMNKIAYDDPQNLQAAYAIWEQAISTDPTYTPALERQLNYLQESRIFPTERPSPALYDMIQTVAKKILTPDPKNLAARIAQRTAVIDSWNPTITNDHTSVDAAVSDLVDLQKEDPTNPEIPFYIARASVALGNRAQTNNDTAEAQKYFNRANSGMEDALKTNDASGKLHYRAAQIYLGEMSPPGDEKKFAENKERARVQAVRAAELVKPTDPEFDDVIVLAANLAMDPSNVGKPPTTQRSVEDALKDMVAQEKVYRDALKLRPNDVSLTVHLAELISMRYDRRDEAIDLLKNLPEPMADDKAGPRGLMIRNTQAQGLATLTNLRLDKLGTLKAKSEQDALMAQIETDYHKLEVRAPDNAQVLRLKAKMQIAKGQVTDAVTTLAQAIPKTDSRQPLHYELMYLSAKCYLATNQIGSAQAYLQDIVDHISSHYEARLLLIDTELRSNQFKAAEENLATLEKLDARAGDDIRVIKMRIACLQQEKKFDEAKKIYARIPEETRNQKLDKATIAFVMNQPDEAKRLLESVASADPGDIDAALMLSNFYNRNKDIPGAVAAIDRALKAKPDNTDLQMAKAQLSGSSPAQMKQIQMDAAQKIADPLERELALLDLTRDSTDENVPLQHLKNAEKINPNDPRVLNANFEYYMIHRNWDAASPYLERLAQMNADKVKGTLLRWRMAMAQAAAEQDPKRRDAALVKALDLATQLTHDYQEFAQSWICLGQTNEALGRFEEAVPHFNAAKEKQPQNADAYRGLIDCYYQLKRPDDAGKTIDQALVALPSSPMFKEMKLQHELQYGQPETVVADREQAVKNQPDSPQALMQLAQVYAAVARAKNDKPQTEKESNAWLEKSKNTLAQGAEKFPNELQFTISHGGICQMLNDIDAGEKLWKTTIARDQWKNNPDAISAFADFYVRSKKPDDAEKLYRDYLATDAGKNSAEMTMRLVNLLASEKKYDAAIVLIDSKPDDAQFRLRKIDLLVEQNKLADAEKLITNVMQTQKSPELTTALAYIYLNSNRAKEALDLLNGVLADHPNMVNAIYFRALATLRQPNANPNDALSDLVQVRQDMPQNLQARYLLADCLQSTNDIPSAIKELEGILQVSPAQKTARIKLMALYAAQSPPRWLDAERVARDGDALPELAGDVDFLAAEARMYSKRGDTDRAVRFAKQAMTAQPQNLGLLQTYYDVLIEGKRYQDVMAESDKLPKENKDLWWVHAFRGTALTKLGKKDAGSQEFVAALNATFAAKDDNAGRVVTDQMVQATGADAALKVISKLPQASEPQWMLSIAWLQQKKGDLPASRKTIDQVLDNLKKLEPQQQKVALSFAGSVYMQTPDPNYERARDIYLQLLALTPDDYAILNNLACNRSVSAPEALQYAQKAFQKMQDQHAYEPLVADTYGWALIQSGDERNLDVGLNVLLDAWKSKHVVDTAYHIGAAYLKKNNGPDADRYLTQAQTLYTEALANKDPVDLTLQADIVDAQQKAAKLMQKR